MRSDLYSFGNVTKGMPIYKGIFQGNAVNGLFFLSDKKIKKSLKEKLAKTLNETHLDLGMPIRKVGYDNTRYWIVPGKIALKGRTKQMYDFIIMKFTEKVPVNSSADFLEKYKEFLLDVNEIAYYFGISPRAARDIAVETILTLTRINIERLDIADKEKLNDPEDILLRRFPAVQELVMYPGGKFIKNGKLIVVLHQRLVEYLSMTYVMPYNLLLFSLDTGNYTNAYEFGKKMTIHYNINFRKNNRNILSTKTLLDSAQDIPLYIDAINKGKHVNQQIIRPFIRDMNYLVERNILAEWYFCAKKTGEKLKANPNGLSYDIFHKLNVFFRLSDYPKELPHYSPEKINDADKYFEDEGYSVEEIML